MFEAFEARARAAGAEVHHFPTASGAMDFLRERLKAEGVAEGGERAVLAPGFPMDPCPGLICPVTREAARTARVGITRMGWGLADTGTLVQDSTAVEQRLASSLPWVHIALLPTRALLPDLASLLERVDPDRAAYLAFITGPSRTADIERVLAIGVHGPEKLVIVCVDDLEVAP
nr:lactate utilization protein [uncultured Holophaga sp.]